MISYYVRIIVLNYELTKKAKNMIHLNKYKRLDNGKYYKDVKIICKCKTDDKAISFIMNKFNKIAECNSIKMKVEIYRTPKYNKKIAEKLTKTFY